MEDARESPPIQLRPVAVLHRDAFLQGVRSPGTDVLVPFAISRILLLAVSSAVALLQGKSLLDVWNKLDAQWYVGIATHGYSYSIAGKSAVAFFPLYPLLMKMGILLRIPALLTGILISNAAFLAAMFLLHRLVTERWDRDAAQRSIWIITFFPTSLFTFAPYTEALFLCFVIGSFHHAVQDRPLRAGIAAAAAILTRSTGVILLPPILLLLGPRRLRSWLLGIGPAALAAVFYCGYLAMHHIAPVSILHAQRAWHRSLTFPWTGFTASISWLARHSTGDPGWIAENLLQLGITILFLCLTVRAWRWMDAAAALYCAGFWLLVLVSPEWQDDYFAPFSSMNRFVLALFPLAVWFGVHAPTKLFRLTLLLFAVLLSGATAVHLCGGWVG